MRTARQERFCGKRAGIRFRPQALTMLEEKTEQVVEDALPQALEDGGLDLNVLTFPQRKRQAAEAAHGCARRNLWKGLEPQELGPKPRGAVPEV